MHEVLKQHLRGVASLLSAYYQTSKTLHSPSVLGNLRELFVREVLHFFLPSVYEILGGEITDSTGRKSRQQDIIIYRRDMPKLQMIEGPALLFAEGVKATIEIKSNLTWEKFEEALTNVCSVKALKPCINPFAVGEKADYIFCYVFAYEGPSDKTIINYNRFASIKNWTKEQFFENIPDALYILNGSLFYKNDGYIWKKTESNVGKQILYCKSDHPVATDKFFLHLAIALNSPDIFTIDWRSYLE